MVGGGLGAWLAFAAAIWSAPADDQKKQKQKLFGPPLLAFVAAVGDHCVHVSSRVQHLTGLLTRVLLACMRALVCVCVCVLVRGYLGVYQDRHST